MLYSGKSVLVTTLKTVVVWTSMNFHGLIIQLIVFFTIVVEYSVSMKM